MYNKELLAIIKALKNLCYYLKCYKNEFLILTNYNSLYLWKDIKALSFC